jgi:hypothetical protein
MVSCNVTPTTTAHRSTSRLDQRGSDLYISSIVREIETICILLALSSSQGTGCVAASRRCPSWQLHSNGERGESFLLVVLRLLQTYYINCREEIKSTLIYGLCAKSSLSLWNHVMDRSSALQGGGFPQFGGRGRGNRGGFGQSEAEEESPRPSSVVGINMEWRIVLSQTAGNTLMIYPPISEYPSSSAILTSTGQRMEKALLFLDRRRIQKTRSLLPRRRRVVFQFRT